MKSTTQLLALLLLCSFATIGRAQLSTTLYANLELSEFAIGLAYAQSDPLAPDPLIAARIDGGAWFVVDNVQWIWIEGTHFGTTPTYPLVPELAGATVELLCLPHGEGGTVNLPG